MAVLLHDHREGCERVATMLREHPDPEASSSPAEDAIAACRAFFDRAVGRSEVASVAAYSLGDPDLLGRATREVVDLLERWGVLGPGRPDPGDRLRHRPHAGGPRPEGRPRRMASTSRRG